MSQRYVIVVIVAALLAASAFPLLTASHYPAFLNDDTYITLTYAKNLAKGRGFVFNHPPPVLGTTSPLFAMTVAGLAMLLPQAAMDRIAVYVTAICWLGIAWVIFSFRRSWRLEDWEAGIVGLVVIASGWIGFLGMESYPFTFLLTLCLSLFFSGHYFAAGLTAGLLFLTRGEGILIAGMLFITAVLQSRRTPQSVDGQLTRRLLMLGVGLALPMLLWCIYAQFTFGAVLPNTLAAKQAHAHSGLWRPFWQRLTHEWMPFWGKSFALEGAPWLNAWWIISLTGIVTALLKKRRWLAFALWAVLYTAAYSTLNVAGYFWYQLPVVFVLNHFFALGIITVTELLHSRMKPAALSLGLSMVITGLLIFLLSKPAVRMMLHYGGDERGKTYTAMSKWFREHTEITSSIAFIEIGYLGYYTDNRIIDLAGLITPGLLPHIAEKDFAWGFWQYQPDYYVHLSDFDWALAGIRSDPRFERDYEWAATLQGPRVNDLVIFKRVARQDAREESG